MQLTVDSVPRHAMMRHMLENQPPIQRDKVQDQVYGRLCKLLCEGAFAPGQAIPVSKIAAAFGVSAMPVREALTRLRAIGALANVSGRSVGVAVLGHDELVDLRNVRVEIETLAVRWAIQNRDEAFLAELDDLLDRLETAERSGDVEAYIKANYNFHSRLYRQSQSPFLIRTIDAIWLRVSPALHRLEGESLFRIPNIQHRTLVQSIRQGDGEAASDALVADIATSYNVLVQTL